jgi:hypothetical protein
MLKLGATGIEVVVEEEEEEEDEEEEEEEEERSEPYEISCVKLLMKISSHKVAYSAKL